MKKVRRKKRKVRKIWIDLTLLIIFFISCNFIFISIQEWCTLFYLQNNIKDMQQQINSNQQTLAILKQEKTKFQDIEYLKYYARGKYLLTKEGEFLYKKVTKRK